MTAATGGPEELLRFDLPSEEGNERVAVVRVAAAAEGAGLGGEQLERLKTAVAEATMNGIEHGNHGRSEVPVEIAVFRDGNSVVVTVTDRGGAGRDSVPAEKPDLDMKLAGLQRARGWGLFLIEHMVDEIEDTTDGELHTVRLVMRHRSTADSDGEPANTAAKGASDGNT